MKASGSAPETLQMIQNAHTICLLNCERVGKKTLVIFLTEMVIIHQEFLPESQTVNVSYYKDIKEQLLKGMSQVRPTLFQMKDWFLLHNSAVSHNTVSVKQFLSWREISMPHHPPYSPADYFLIPKLTTALKVWHFQSIMDLRCSYKGNEQHSKKKPSWKGQKKFV